MDDILSLFHHIHHQENKHQVHHCGGSHSKINRKLDYNIYHCKCQKHCIDKPVAMGHAISTKGASLELSIVFYERCPEGGYHIESGKIT